MTTDLREAAAMTDKEKALLNKVFRAVHDHVCPSCGNDLQLIAGRYYYCGRCKFEVTTQEMMRMEPIVEQWGREAVEFFKVWRTRE
jgi:predicted amidophosphoribosyltransferase